MQSIPRKASRKSRSTMNKCKGEVKAAPYPCRRSCAAAQSLSQAGWPPMHKTGRVRRTKMHRQRNAKLKGIQKDGRAYVEAEKV